MLIKVLLGTIRMTDRVIKTGETVEVAENFAKEWIRQGIVEEVKAIKKVEEKKEEEEKITEPVVELEVKSVEPSIDWTRTELNDYAKSKGIEEPEKFNSKSVLLEAIKGVK